MNASRLLFPLSLLYGAGISIRNLLYDAEYFQIKKVGVPVISVGNITAGGTGKTPFVEYLLRKTGGKKIAVVSRGYRRSTQGLTVVSDGSSLLDTAERSGDEPYQIAKKFPGTIVIADENRVRGAQYAIKQYNAGLIILDDGFQHRKIARDLDIVMVGTRMPLNEIPLIPAGKRREHLSSLLRADVVVLSGSSGSDGSYLRTIVPGARFIHVQLRPVQYRQLADGTAFPLSSLKGKPVFAFCGIASPQKFQETLRETGVTVNDNMMFPDHHQYTRDDIQSIRNRFEQGKSEIIVTTEKDAVRFHHPALRESITSLPIYFLEIEATVVDGEDILTTLLAKTLGRAA